MKERPILFSGPMVQAILSGAKTQTRRVVKLSSSLNPGCADIPAEATIAEVKGDTAQWYDRWGGHYREAKCPYGKVGDRLWVRETLQLLEVNDYPQQFDWCYAADEEPIPEETVNTTALPFGEPFQKIPSIHMPKWASRLTLEITEVRVQRLQDISPEDCVAEGACGPDWLRPDIAPILHGDELMSQPVSWFRSLWDRVNGKDAWKANPWIWCLSFRRVEEKQ